MKNKEIDIIVATLEEVEAEHMIKCNVRDIVEDESRKRNIPYVVVKREYIAKDPKMAKWL